MAIERSLTRIRTEEYKKSVQLLAALARTDTSGGRVAAQVVLSAYNGNEWQLDVTELGLLDGRYYVAALNVIRGRNELMLEPHRLIPNGQEVFHHIWDQWRRYHISNRWKQTCIFCNGRGTIIDYDDNDRESASPCRRCNGEGLIASPT